MDVDSCFVLDQLISGVWDGHGKIPDLTITDGSTLKLLLPESVVMDDLDDEVAADFKRAVSALADAGAEIQTVAMPVVDGCVDIFMTRAVVGYEALKHHAELLENYEHEYDPFVSGRMKNFSSVSDEEQQSRYQDKAKLKAEFTRLMNAGGFDGILLTSTVHIHKLLIYKETQKYLGTTNARILKDYVNQYSG